MKTKLEYEFKDNEDDSRFYMICNAEGLYYTLYDLDQDLRNLIKYGSEEQGLDSDTLQHVRDKLHELMDDHGCDFEHVS